MEDIQPIESLTELCSLTGRVAVITGGAQGIGFSCARRLIEAGASTAIFDINKEKMEQAVKILSANTDTQVMGVHIDSTDVTGVRLAMEKVATALGGLHILVNNAGIFPELSVLDITDADYDRLMGLNQRGMFLAARDAASLMKNQGQGGVIINIISISGLIAATNSAHYVASKHAIAGATKAFARDLAPYGIRVLAIAPTLIQTPGVEAGLRASNNSKKALDAFLTRIPLGRAGKADEVARVVFFAASQLSAFMTGSILIVDGGELVL